MKEVGLESYTPSLKNGESLEMKELISVYSILGNKKSMEELSLAEQNEIIPLLYAIVARTNPGAFMVDSFFQVISGSKNKYLQRMSEFVGDSISDATYLSIFTVLKFTRESATAFINLRNDPEKSWIFYCAIGAIALGGVAAVILRKPLATAAIASAIII